jgi:flagellar assembly protein FliH
MELIMSREVLSSQSYRYLEQGYLVDNATWQEEIKRRFDEGVAPRITEHRPTLNPEEFQPFLLPENPEAVEAVMVVEPTEKEIAEKFKVEAEEKAKAIEQTARKNAYEILEKARWEANDLISNAKEAVEKEIQQLKEKAGEEGRNEGVEKGRPEGFEKGREDGQRTYSEIIEKWNGLLAETILERKRILGEIRPMLIDLVGESLYRCLKKEAKRQTQLVIEMVEEVLKKAQDRVLLKLHLNPEDAEEVESQKERLQLSVGAGEIEIVPDARIERGGCVLETEAGSVDGRLSTIVGQVKNSLGQEIPV